MNPKPIILTIFEINTYFMASVGFHIFENIAVTLITIINNTVILFVLFFDLTCLYSTFILQIKAVDNGRPQKSSTCRLHIEWIPKPEPNTIPLAFDEPFYSFSVMESDPVAHMVGVITMDSVDTPVWFEITGMVEVNPPEFVVCACLTAFMLKLGS